MSSSKAETARLPAAMQADEYELLIHYEQKLLSCFYETSLGKEGLIKDETEWDCLIAMFLKHRLISVEDSKKFDAFKPSFPLNFQTLLSTITQVFGDEQIKSLNQHMSDCKEQLENCRTYINMLNIRSLSAQELYQLATTLYSCMGKAKSTEKALGQVVGKIKGQSEDS